jgi:hypothetical protein
MPMRMPARRCPHCGLINPARTMTCDCGYSFLDGSPPRFSHDKPHMGGDDLASRVMTRVVIRVAAVLLVAGGVIAIRACG